MMDVPDKSSGKRSSWYIGVRRTEPNNKVVGEVVVSEVVTDEFPFSRCEPVVAPRSLTADLRYFGEHQSALHVSTVEPAKPAHVVERLHHAVDPCVRVGVELVQPLVLRHLDLLEHAVASTAGVAGVTYSALLLAKNRPGLALRCRQAEARPRHFAGLHQLNGYDV